MSGQRVELVKGSGEEKGRGERREKREKGEERK